MMVKKSATVMFLFVGLFGIWMGGCETQEQKVERLIKQLGHKKVKVRVSAARALGLGSIRSEDAIDAVPALIKALQDPEVRWYAAGALGSIRSKKAQHPLIL
jgi:HEAT repeat protein